MQGGTRYMPFEESTLTLGGESRKIKSLDFFKLGTVGKTDAKGETTVVAGEYTFLVTGKTLRFRHKPAGARTSKPVKHVKTFAELDKLPVGTVPEVETKNQNTLVQSTEEEIIMAKLNVEGKQIEIPAAAATALKNLGVKGSIVELSDFDSAIAKAKDKDLEALSAFEEVIQAELGAGAATTPDEKEIVAPKVDKETGAVEGAEAIPATGTTPGASPLAGANIFGTSGGEGGGGRQGTRAPKTEAEKEAERLARQNKRETELALIKEKVGKIEEVRSEISGVTDAKETMEALKTLILIDGKVPLFRTLVPSDTRLRAEVKNTIKPADRVYHPALQGNPEYKKVGKDIEPKYALGAYQLHLRESNPSQPSGFFIYMPEALMNFTPSKLSLHSERETILAALNAGSKDLVIKFLPKAEMILLLTVLNADIVEYNLKTQKYNDLAPHIYLTSKIDEQQNVPVFSLRAKDSEGRATKLSIRKFIPMATHDTIKTSAKEFDQQWTTDALFKRLLMNIPDGAPANKFSQLVQESAALFTQKPDGSILYTQFKNMETVTAYDSTTSRPAVTDVPLPLVKMSNPTTQGAVARPIFSKSKHTEPGYNPLYRADKDAVGDQINKQRRQTNKSILTAHTEEINRMTAINDLLTGSQIKIK